jgi:hypothetical protein
MQRQKGVLALFKDELKSGELHALTIKAKTAKEKAAESSRDAVQPPSGWSVCAIARPRMRPGYPEEPRSGCSLSIGSIEKRSLACHHALRRSAAAFPYNAITRVSDRCSSP